MFPSNRTTAFGVATSTPARTTRTTGISSGASTIEGGRPVSEYFGSMTFGLAQMRERLPKEAYQSLLDTLENGKKLSKDTANAVAIAIKEWAVSKGATHFSHWFQPMTGVTAEKHEAFISIQHTYHSELKVIERFTGDQLIQGEPDASSFPSGGMRSVFEARGYTAWDPSSPIFIVEDEEERTLCIPTVFFGYHGQALDNKTPLLRSVEALSEAGCEFLRLLGDGDVKKISCSLGIEQEYFLIDRTFVAQRPDLYMTGRTLLGASSLRGQQLEDHYFGSVPSRVKTFMKDCEYELFRLGVPLKTRHNEAAPSQFELVPIFEDVNIAADHNALTMEVLKRVALKHGFVCLLHEKPFLGVNGSGKHNNWSVSNDKGENLLEPGRTPHENLRFLAVITVVLKAVHDHADMLRASVASPGNDHRLGANEAPPAIVSVFLGSLLEKILNSIEEGKVLKATEQQIIDLGVCKIPDISKDYTDRNRTSPFAFTGNKFEFRAVGSSANVAMPMTVLNGAVAFELKQATTSLVNILKSKPSRDEAVIEFIRQTVKQTKNIRFDGNGYSDEWKLEARRRGLPILSTTGEALAVLADKKATRFLVESKVFTEEELVSRYHVNVERYIKTLDLEHDTLIEMVQVFVVPALQKQMLLLTRTQNAIENESLAKVSGRRKQEFEKVFAEVLNQLEQFIDKVNLTRQLVEEVKRVEAIVKELQPAAGKLRSACDQAETLVADNLWPLPKYREMLLANSLT